MARAWGFSRHLMSFPHQRFQGSSQRSAMHDIDTQLEHLQSARTEQMLPCRIKLQVTWLKNAANKIG
jgi:hypothetical protein